MIYYFSGHSGCCATIPLVSLIGNLIYTHFPTPPDTDCVICYEKVDQVLEGSMASSSIVRKQLVCFLHILGLLLNDLDSGVQTLHGLVVLGVEPLGHAKLIVGLRNYPRQAKCYDQIKIEICYYLESLDKFSCYRGRRHGGG